MPFVFSCEDPYQASFRPLPLGLKFVVDPPWTSTKAIAMAAKGLEIGTDAYEETKKKLRELCRWALGVDGFESLGIQ